MRHVIQTVKDARTVFDAHRPSDHIELYQHAMLIPGFWTAPASVKWHHVFEGGLAVHTAQVMLGTIALLESLGVHYEGDKVPIAVIWHDIGKTLDYEKKEVGWGYTDHYKAIGHLSKSVMLMHAAAVALAIPTKVSDRIASLMLSHHGRRDWGSPIEPHDAEAWAIHTADMLSAKFIEAPVK